MKMDLNTFNLQQQLMGFDNVEHSTINWVCDFFFEEMEFDHEEK